MRTRWTGGPRRTWATLLGVAIAACGRPMVSPPPPRAIPITCASGAAPAERLVLSDPVSVERVTHAARLAHDVRWHVRGAQGLRTVEGKLAVQIERDGHVLARSQR